MPDAHRGYITLERRLRAFERSDRSIEQRRHAQGAAQHIPRGVGREQR
jgi:hypothetical protein